MNAGKKVDDASEIIMNPPESEKNDVDKTSYDLSPKSRFSLFFLLR